MISSLFYNHTVRMRLLVRDSFNDLEHADE